MTLAELMTETGVVPNPAYAGFSTADDEVFAIDFTGTATDPNEFVVAQAGIKEHPGKLEAQEEESQYMRTGKKTTKTGTSRSFSISGDRCHGDAFQDALLSHELKYGKGDAVVKPYVYFNILTGIGEKGKVSIAVEEDTGGSAGGNATISATMKTTAEPTEYTYAPPSA